MCASEQGQSIHNRELWGSRSGVTVLSVLLRLDTVTLITDVSCACSWVANEVCGYHVLPSVRPCDYMWGITSETPLVEFHKIRCRSRLLIPVAALSKAWVCCRWLAGVAGSNLVGGMNVSCESCVLSGGGLWVGLITRPEDSYWVWSVWVWSWSLDNGEALAHWGLLAVGKKELLLKSSAAKSVRVPRESARWQCVTHERRSSCICILWTSVSIRVKFGLRGSRTVLLNSCTLCETRVEGGHI
jgi:hypothetical protein